MIISRIDEREQHDVQMDGATQVKMRLLIGPDEDAPNFHMRHFEVAPGGCTPHHNHDYEHEIVVLRGAGLARSEQGDRFFKAGDIIFVSPGEKHQFVNNGDEPLQFICVVPAPQA